MKLLKPSAVISVLDTIFYWREEYLFEGMLCVHVDDFLWAGTSFFEKFAISKSRENFLIGILD